MENLEPKIMKYVPAVKKHMISAAWIDGDGYWIELKDGFNAGRMDVSGCHTIHEETINDLRYQITGIDVDRQNPPEVKIVYSPLQGAELYYVEYAGEVIMECLGKDEVEELTWEKIEKLCQEIGGFV